MPMGRPGCPDLACSVASIARARMASAMRRAGVIGRARISVWRASMGFSDDKTAMSAMKAPYGDTAQSERGLEAEVPDRARNTVSGAWSLPLRHGRAWPHMHQDKAADGVGSSLSRHGPACPHRR